MNTYLKISRSIVYILMICALSLPLMTGASAGVRTNASELVVGPNTVYVPFIAAPNFSIFGVMLHQPVLPEELKLVKSAGMGWSRIGLDWNLIEPANGIFDWSQASSVEQALVATSQAGMQPIMLLESTPAWALKPGFACGAVREDLFPEFVNFAKEAVKRYSASPYNVKYFEIYNEPDAAGLLGCWGSPNDPLYGGTYYGQFLQTVYPAIKSVNPKVQVLVGGLLLDCDPVNPPVNSNGQKKDCSSGRFFEGILSSGAGNSFDGVSFHSYDYYGGLGLYSNFNWHSDRTLNGSSTLPKAAYLRSTMQKYAVPVKPLFNTEYALFCGAENKNECNSFQTDVETTKAYYIVQFIASAYADGYQAAVWYAIMGGRNNSLLNPDFTPLPAYNAYKFTNQKIANASYSQRVSDAVFLIHEFKKPNGKIWIVWTNDNLAHTLTLPALPKAIYRIGADGNGITDPLTTSVTLDKAPAIIEFNQ